MYVVYMQVEGRWTPTFVSLHAEPARREYDTCLALGETPAQLRLVFEWHTWEETK
jgi:hypothetical protein